MEVYEDFIHLSRYSRYLEEEGRRETFPETVDRLVSFWKDQVGELVPAEVFDEIREEILNKEVMPSMRSMWSAGPALAENHFRGYNCAFTAVDHQRVFDEALFILMAGTGLGFSVEKKNVNKLPYVNDHFTNTGRTIVIEDSAEGWAKALRKFIADLYLGNIHKWDTSKIRPEGARLKTMGGRASGPEPLMELFRRVEDIFRGAAGRKLSTIECHDIMCLIAMIVVVGGVRRSALISLSDLDDANIRDCKSMMDVETFLLLEESETHWKYSITFDDIGYGKKSIIVDFDKRDDNEVHEKLQMEQGKLGWWRPHPERALSNNSAIHDEKPQVTNFMDEWNALISSGSGERGVFSRYGARNRKVRLRDTTAIVGCNPCAEILLRSAQLCNLSEVVARAGDSLADLKRKIKIATILGTFQATLTKFKYVRKIWQTNCEEERLLGVSLTGIQDCELLQNPDPEDLKAMKEVAIETNIEFSKMLGINPATAITTIKPSGTVSQFVNSSSGIHGRFSPYYVRAVRQSNNDPLTQMMRDQGVPNEPDSVNPKKTTVFYFPIKSPAGAVLANDQSAIDQLENWLKFQENWSEHSVSVTIYVKEDEWLDVASWVYKHMDRITGISFLPYVDHDFKQAPYQSITENEYDSMISDFPEIDFNLLAAYEEEDNTSGAQELACVAGGCEI